MGVGEVWPTKEKHAGRKKETITEERNTVSKNKKERQTLSKKDSKQRRKKENKK